MRHISCETRSDLVVWRDFLSYLAPGKQFQYLVAGAVDFTLVTDASGSIGYGGFWGNTWFHGMWPDELWTNLIITVLELFPIFVAVHMWKKKFTNSVVEVRTDNGALVSILEHLYCKYAVVSKLLRLLALLCMQQNILLVARHIPGLENIAADLLSRNKIREFKLCFPSMAACPTSLPVHLCPRRVKNIYWS